MLRSPWGCLLFVTLLGVPLAIRLRGSRSDRVFLLAWFHLLYGSLFVLISPEGKSRATAHAAMGLVGLDLMFGFLPLERVDGIIRLARSPRAMAAMTVLTLTLSPLAAVEVVCRTLTNHGLLRYHQPIETVWKAGHDDWRTATITADIYHETDPVLLWRPVPSRPYNAQRFKGPIASIPKPPGIIRVFCYGDSLTDGPSRGDWPSRLHRLLNEQLGPSGPRFEVINAGVSGYSSHQGLARFLQEVDEYQPDLILAGFGWNDVAQAVGPPDREFRPPPAPLVAIQRRVVRYRSYLVLTAYMRTLFAEPPADEEHLDNPRVSIPDYLANLDRFRAEAASRGIPIVFLTRPHEQPPDVLRAQSNWRRHVPDYNEALRSWTLENNLALIDAQAWFEQQPKGLFSDECHFHPPGNEKLAELVRDRLLLDQDRFFQVVADPAGLIPSPGMPEPRSQPIEQTASTREP